MKSGIYDIQKVHYICSRWNVLENQKAISYHYKIKRDGTIRTYETHYDDKEYFNSEKYVLLADKVETFFEELRDFIDHTKYEIERIDDTSCSMKIKYSDVHYEVISGNTSIDENQSIDDLFWDFLDKLE